MTNLKGSFLTGQVDCGTIIDNLNLKGNEGVAMTYFDNFLKANQAYVSLHGDLHLPIKPKTKVAIVTCMDSRLHVAPALDRRYDSLARDLSAADGNSRNRSSAPYRLWGTNL